ncbi:MAG: dockerin type I domain-containing protein [Pirellulaceae bacterium]
MCTEAGEWSITVTATDRGTPLQFSSSSFLLKSVANSSIWRNETNPLDVNQDGEITPLDALIVMNRLSATEPSMLAAQRFDDDFFVDVNGDNAITGIDALRVFNWLNRQSTLNAIGGDSAMNPLPAANEIDDDEEDALAAFDLVFASLGEDLAT